MRLRSLDDALAAAAQVWRVLGEEHATPRAVGADCVRELHVADAVARDGARPARLRAQAAAGAGS